MSRFMIASLVFAATACVSNGTNDPDPDPNPDPDPQTSFVPRTGEWGYADITPVTNDCGYDVGGQNGGDFVIDTASATGFHIIPGDGTNPFSCSLAAGSSFNCPERAADSEDLRPSIDALITAHVTAAGTFTASTRASGHQDATVSCSGSQCSTLGQWPCHFKVNFVIATL